MKKILVLLMIVLLFGNVGFAHSDYDLFYGKEDNHSLTLMFTGDIMVHGTQYLSAYKASSGEYDFSPWFHYILGHFTSSDYLIGNLETTLTEDPTSYSGFPRFRSPVAIAKALKNASFDVIATANNHSADNGFYGIETTLKHLENNGLIPVGTAYGDKENLPIIIDNGRMKIGIFSSTFGTNGMPVPSGYPHMVNVTTEELIDEQIAYLKSQQVDGILAFVHWGHEYQRKAHSSQVEVANLLSSKGVDWIIGSHPHSIQPDGYVATEKKVTYVNYSLGNLISNQRWRYSDTGLILSLTIEKFNDSLYTDVDYLPFWVDKEDEYNQISYTIIPLIDPPEINRLSPLDRRLMDEALSDFYELYPNAKK
ncbi:MULTISPECIES: CapA family protein [unclassified Fusibacter]|uniref:CapA family protein n=1 Tax=unclassified Fusibacter TaxID=2624464 RepID=UPI0013E95CE7|nr:MULTISPECIES: CapA family protein [unclassified Fusibacter]MCK8058698.1 CapA family protein [Fusibacter sp. A2]NPE21772.1 CapA family protein [Fusibacter sp. A1]